MIIHKTANSAITVSIITMAMGLYMQTIQLMRLHQRDGISLPMKITTLAKLVQDWLNTTTYLGWV